FIYKYSFFFIY
ncbi:hypothetical protein Trydic_g12876, partial [Trypoxylus dichotomus]